MKEAGDILSNSTRATLFGRFYENIIRKWLEVECRFKVHAGKPRIYWKEQPPLQIRYRSERLKKLLNILEDNKQSKSHCTPDGLLEKDGKYFIWQAKNWPKWPEPIESVLWSSPWLLAQKVNYRGTKLDVDGIVFSWWSRPQNEALLLANVRMLIFPLSFDVYYTREILNECIEKQPKWYRSLIEEQRHDIEGFFLELLGEDD